jgi:hypothetical protein
MGFFDRGEEDEDTEEVTLSVPEEEEENRGQLKDEAEARLTGGDSGSSSDSDSSQDTSGMLPGMGSGSSSGSSSSSSSTSSTTRSSRNSSSGDVSMEDIHKQNKQIKSILKDIRSELKDEGDMNGVL